MKKKMFICLSFIILFLCFLFVKFNFYIDIQSKYNNSQFEYSDTVIIEKPKIILKGKYIFKKGISINQKYLSMNDDINIHKLGSYTIKYNSKFLIWSSYKEDIVEIIDTVSPELILLGHNPVTLLPFENYEEEGFTAFDNYDGDITSNVNINITDDVIIYSIEDSSGNKTEKKRQIIYDDPNPPKIELLGDKEITLYVGENYIEPGYSAIDDCDGDISSKVIINSDLDVTKEGKYNIIYSVSDSFNNTTEDMKTIFIIPQPEEEEMFSEKEIDDKKEIKGTIYLTFDDGPGKYTEQLLDILNKYNIKATFFVVNGKYNYIMKRIVDEGHAIGIHSFTHDYKTIYSSEEAFFNDLYLMQDTIYNETGVLTTLMRFPGGSSNTISKKYSNGIMTSLSQKVIDNGFQYFDWNVSSGDAGGTKQTNTIISNVVNGIDEKENAIVLQHDVKEYSVNAVEQIILWGLENGYNFDVLSMDSFYSHHHINN